MKTLATFRSSVNKEMFTTDIVILLMVFLITFELFGLGQFLNFRVWQIYQNLLKVTQSYRQAGILIVLIFCVHSFKFQF